MLPSYEAQIPREVDPETVLPIGPRLANPGPALAPSRVTLTGRYCRLEPLAPTQHREDLWNISTVPDAAQRFRYLFSPLVTRAEDLEDWMQKAVGTEDPLVFVAVDLRTQRVVGRQALMRITPAHRCIEIGDIYWGPEMARTRLGTEANFLFAQYVFDVLGYRRYEWKCDALNAPSRRAALRFGFSYEGHFRRAIINKGRTRDTSWYAMIDEEWPSLKKAYEQWLAPTNFDADGTQRTRLSDLTHAALNLAPT